MRFPLIRSLPLLVADPITPAARRNRKLIFLAWLLLVAWLLWVHVLWRDEVRAYSLALSGSDVAAMLHNIHGEGHPALWYLMLRGIHDLFPYRDVLPALAAIIGIGAMALFAFISPFRTWVIALGLFSLFGAFEYVVVARNYGISAFFMFALAAFYGRVKHSPWFGLILAGLCNTNVPSCIFAAAFLLFRLVELLTADERSGRREWMIMAVNAALALTGAILCSMTVYPPLNDNAVSTNFGSVTAAGLGDALVDGRRGFSHLVLNLEGPIPSLLLWGSCCCFIRRPPALIASVAALLALKLFYMFVYGSAYRHEALFVVFLLSLLWMTTADAPGQSPTVKRSDALRLLGTASFTVLLAVQSLDLAKPLYLQAAGVPFSRSRDLALLLQRPPLSRAVVMADPDVMLEPLPYYSDHPLWFLRESRFDRLYVRTRADRRQLTLNAMLSDADNLHRRLGLPIVIVTHAALQDRHSTGGFTMYRDSTVVTPSDVRRFWASTRLVARLRPAITDEAYDVYLYPR